MRPPDGHPLLIVWDLPAENAGVDVDARVVQIRQEAKAALADIDASRSEDPADDTDTTSDLHQPGPAPGDPLHD